MNPLAYRVRGLFYEATAFLVPQEIEGITYEDDASHNNANEGE